MRSSIGLSACLVVLALWFIPAAQPSQADEPQPHAAAAIGVKARRPVR